MPIPGFERWVFITCAALGVACGASEDEVQREFDALVAASNVCERDSDCVEISPGCPLGCGVPVNAKHKQKVERRARELIHDYETGGRSCEYDCLLRGQVACIADRCHFAPLDAGVAANR